MDYLNFRYLERKKKNINIGNFSFPKNMPHTNTLKEKAHLNMKKNQKTKENSHIKEVGHENEKNLFLSKLHNHEYTFPEDKNILKFMKKDDERIIWRKITNYKEVPFYFKKLKTFITFVFLWKVGCNLDFFTTTLNSNYYFDSWFNFY